MNDDGLIRTEYDVTELLVSIRSEAGPLAVDTETTGLHPYRGDVIRGISVAGETWSAYLPITHPDTLNFHGAPLCRALLDHGRLVFHHGVFDYAFLAQVAGLGIRYADVTIWDTQVGNWLIDENLKKGLKESADRILGHDSSAEKAALKALTKETKRTWDTFTGEDIAKYAAMDARLTYDLYAWQHAQADYDFHTAMMRELAVQRAIFEMNRTGIGVDRDKLHEFELVAMERINEIEESLPINLKSPKQVGEWLFGELGYEAKILTATGKPSTSKQALQDLAHESQEASLLLEHRTLTKEVSAYYRPLIVASGPGTTGIGTVNPHFSSTRTVTGRLSCSDPNLQTIPRADVMGGVRECFVPREGNELWAFDLSQAELRVIAGYCKEDAMIDALENGRDLHSETALSIFGPDFTPLQRRFAKNLNFGFPYGIGPHKFATYIHPVPTERHVREAAEILAGYRRTYPNIVRTMEKLDKIACKQGYLPLGWSGRRRHFRGPGYIVPGYTGLNAIVQGGIGEFMKDVMIHPALADQCRGYGSRLVLQIHDELVFEVLPGTVGSLKVCLDGIAKDLDPFYMKMIWDRKQWT